ncbi:MAG: efflux RND transporter periplasmic adaptor subunit [Candidatus Aminicenantes bacterium]|nr:efflux RND transporter periplasmic adaptor subunit [Candidatus Aminicenantes bacterium]
MKKKTILIVIGCIAAGLIGWQVYNKGFKNSSGADFQRMAMPVAVELTAVKKGLIQDIGNFTGSLIPKSQFIIAPKISGRLERLLVNIGDEIRRGQLIAVLDDEEYSQQVIQAEADLLVTQANLEETKSSFDTAQREFERVLELHSRGISSDSELDSAKSLYVTQESKYKVAQAQVANKQAALKAAKVRLSYTRIQATWEDGEGIRVVGERFVDEGAMLTPNAPILSILEIDPLIAVIHITDKDYFRVKTGQAATVGTDAIPDLQVAGEIARIAPLLKETSREARLEIEIHNTEELLKPGMFVRVQIVFDSHVDVTIVPVGSVVKRDTQQGVFLADTENKTARFVPVHIGITSNDLAEILEPESLSGYIVTLGQHLLVDGSPLILPQKGPGSPDEKLPASIEAGTPNAKKPGENK